MGRLSRRAVLKAGGAGVVAVAAGPLMWRRPAIAGAPAPEQIHLQFGADAAREMVVSWVTPTSVQAPRLRVGPVKSGPQLTLPAITRHYKDSASGNEVLVHNAPVSGLDPGETYAYEILHDGVSPAAGTFKTGPAARAPFRFTSFGDQTTGDPRDPISTPYATATVGMIEQMDPLFNLVNGDLCYADFGLGYINSTAGTANPYPPRDQTWARWFTNNQPSAAKRPWMPAAGNHENEIGNGPQGYLSYLTRFWLPQNGSKDFWGAWYAFTAGSVRVVVLQNDDVCYQDAGNTYVRGYSAGEQKRWLERTLAQARQDRAIDWIVVCMHQLALSSVRANGPDHGVGNGCDLGIRQEWVPLFDKYGVDLVLCGHDHNYERSHPVRGVVSGSPTRTPLAVGDSSGEIDTMAGTVHLTLGGGGCVIATNIYTGSDLNNPTATVRISRTDTASEAAHWSNIRDDAYAFGFAAIDVDPGTTPGGITRLKVTYYRTPPVASAPPVAFDSFTLKRLRSDGAVLPAATAAAAPVLPNTSASDPSRGLAIAGIAVAAGAALAGHPTEHAPDKQ